MVHIKQKVAQRRDLISVWTVVHTVLMAISQSNGNGQISTPHRIQTP